MTINSIAESGFRADLVEAHCLVVDRLGEPGTWWTSAECVAIAAEVRRAMDHAHLAPWDAPSTVDGLIEPDHPLPPAAVDAVWRLTNHPGSLTGAWYDAIVDGLPSAHHYVELVGIVASMNAIDRLAGALDLDLLPLPEPGGGEPSRDQVDAEVSSHWVPTTAMKGPNVIRALSAVPSANRARDLLSEAQYVPATALLGDLQWRRDGLDRRQIELVAAQTSLLNECFY